MAEGWFRVRYVVGVCMEAQVWAGSADEAIRLAVEDGLCEATGDSYRVSQPAAKRIAADDAPLAPSSSGEQHDG